MANKKFVVKLSGEERGRLSELISKGKAKAKMILKARILLKADQGRSGGGLGRRGDLPRARHQCHDGGPCA
jgi:hypothetical protein